MNKLQITYKQAAVTLQRYYDWRSDRNPNGKGVKMPPQHKTDQALCLAIDVLESLAADERLDSVEANKLKVLKRLFRDAEGTALEKLAEISEQFKVL